MHNADYAVARCPSVRTSVRPSHAGIPSKHVIKLYHRRVADILVFFHTKWYDNIPSNATGMKYRDFRPIFRFISQMLQDIVIQCSYYARRIGNRIPKLLSGTSFNDLEWPLTQSKSRYYSTTNNSKIKIELCLQRPTNRKSYGLSNGAIFNYLNWTTNPDFKVTPFFVAEYPTNGHSHYKMRIKNCTSLYDLQWPWVT